MHKHRLIHQALIQGILASLSSMCVALPAYAAEPSFTPRPVVVSPSPKSDSQIVQVPQVGGSGVSVAGSHGSVLVEAGSGRIVTLGSAVSSVFTADPKVVDVRPASPTTLFLFGVAPGKSTVAAMGASGNLVAQQGHSVLPLEPEFSLPARLVASCGTVFTGRNPGLPG